MSSDNLKTGDEILAEYFKELSTGKSIDSELADMLLELWNQRKLFTKTQLIHSLEIMREKITNGK